MQRVIYVELSQDGGKPQWKPGYLICYIYYPDSFTISPPPENPEEKKPKRKTDELKFEGVAVVKNTVWIAIVQPKGLNTHVMVSTSQIKLK